MSIRASASVVLKKKIAIFTYQKVILSILTHYFTIHHTLDLLF